jgi:hypothetical protein
MRKAFIITFITTLCFTANAQKTFDNEFYFRVGYSNPSWKQFEMDKDMWGDDTWKRGFMGEIGTIFMLKTFGSQENMAIGLDVNYLSVYWHRFTQDQNFSNVDIGTLRFDSKVGPSFTISPVDKLAFDVYVKADISWVTATAIVEDDDADDARGYGRVFCLGFSTGFNVRYGILMVGFEFNTISPKLEDIDNDGEYLGNAKNDGDRSPLPSTNFTIGLSF